MTAGGKLDALLAPQRKIAQRFDAQVADLVPGVDLLHASDVDATRTSS